MARLYVISDGQYEYIDIGMELTIGRSYANRLRLDGPEVSRSHALLTCRDQTNQAYEIQDLESRNGLSVNGTRATQATLRRGDRIAIGSYTLLFDPVEPIDAAQAKAGRRVRSAADNAPRDVAETSFQTGYRHFSLAMLTDTFYLTPACDDLALPRAEPGVMFCHRLIERLAGVGDVDALCRRGLDLMVDELSARRGLVALTEGHDGEARTVAMYDRDQDDEILVHALLLEWLLDRGEALISRPTPAEAEDSQGHEKAHRIAVPITAQRHARGFLYFESAPQAPPFRLEHLQRLYCVGLWIGRRLEADA